ncbi:MAG: ATP-binding protein [Candidatus Sericytochromatia bacterium]
MFNKIIKTLLVEDNPGDARLVKEALYDSQDVQFEITHFDRLKPALEKLKEENFDILLLDLTLPDESGIKTVNRAREEVSNIPIVVLTGLSDHDLALKALQEGAQDYLVKGQVETDLLTRSIRYSIERFQIIASRKESEEKYRSLTDDVLDSSLVGIFILDSSSKIVWVNKSVEQYFGIPREDIINKDKKDLVEKRLKHIFEKPEDFVLNSIDYLNNKDQVQNFECHILKNAHIQDRWLQHFSQPIYSGLYTGGRIEHYTDITERKNFETKQAQLFSELEQANQDLKALSELKSRFVSMVSHEFRTPLTAIMAASDLLKRYSERMTQEQKAARLDKIQREIKHMVQLLEDILVIGRADAGKFPFNPDYINLKQICDDIIEEVKVTYNSIHNIEIIYNNLKETIFADEKIVRHITTNLLSNAIKYSPNNGDILFKIEFIDDKINFIFKDSGIGIPKKDLKNLFEPFHRAENVGDIYGTGLGLAIVKKAVEAHGGNIFVDSESGKGTTFSVSIPLEIELEE